MITLFHGSDKIIEKPHYRGGKPYNDYGYGFYCTKHADLAREWSVDENRDGFLNIYELDESKLNILNLNCGEYTILHWLTILLENRQFTLRTSLSKAAKLYLTKNFSLPYEDADIIIGYRADDSYFSFARDFIDGAISLRQLEKAMFLGSLGEQIVLKSEQSFDYLKFVSYESVLSSDWFERKAERDKSARRQYSNMETEVFQKGEIYITKILEEEIKADDTRLQRIVY